MSEMVGNTALSISQDLPKDVNFAIHLICELTGENRNKIAAMTEDDIYDILSFLLKCEKDKLNKLFREHDQNQALDIKTLQILWKLLEKGVVHKKRQGYTSLDEKIDENIRITVSKIIEKTINLEGNRYLSQTATSNKFTNISVQTAPVISLENLKKLVASYTDRNVSKIIANSTGGISGGYGSM